jgi:hypothetical protein
LAGKAAEKVKTEKLDSLVEKQKINSTTKESKNKEEQQFQTGKQPRVSCKANDAKDCLQTFISELQLMTPKASQHQRNVSENPQDPFHANILPKWLL